MFDSQSIAIIFAPLLAGLLVIATHVPLGREVLKRGIIFIDLAVAQIAGLGVIIALMGDENAGSLRKLAVKALSRIVKVDSSLMSKDQIRDAVAKRFNDEAISVREAAVSLVGFYVLEVPEFAKSFHAPLLLRLNDNGVSVVRFVTRHPCIHVYHQTFELLNISLYHRGRG